MARTEDWSIEVVAEALRRTGGRRVAVAKMLGCSPTTVTRYIERHPELLDAERDAEREVMELCVDTLVASIREGNLDSVKFYLTKKCGWSEKQQIDATLTHTGGVVVLPAIETDGPVGAELGAANDVSSDGSE